MQPLKLTIPGEYWDSQLYEGRLYLFGCEGDIRTVNWDRVVQEWQLEDRLKLAITCAFSQSDYLYGSKWKRLFADDEVRETIRQKFESLTATHLVLSSERVEKYTTGRQDNPFPFPHADATIYKRTAYVASSSGVYSATCNRRTKNPVSSRTRKKWDAPVVALAASYNTLALAAGDEGLFELPVVDHWGDQLSPREHRLGTRSCTDCEWAFYSIYASSHQDHGYLAAFVKEADQERPQRRFDRLIPEEGIFKGTGYSWGTQDKLCQVRNRAVRIVKYEPWQPTFDLRLRDMGTIELSTWKGDVVSGGIALFGVIIECENALVVVPSEGETVTLPGEPVNWRVFPRSKHYENQLHVIYDDRLEIYSFNHDYFVDQETKRSGITYREKWQSSWRSQSRFSLDDDADT